MDKLKAAEMIQKQRRRWQSQDSDMAIASRAKRVYLALGSAFLCIASSFVVLYQHSGLFPQIVAAVFYIGSAIFFGKAGGLDRFRSYWLIQMQRQIHIEWPNKSPEPTSIAAAGQSVMLMAVHIAHCRWLSFDR
jgi:hypothetical protein